MRYQDLRRPRGIESLWLNLRLRMTHRRRPPLADVASLSDHQLRDIGLEPQEDPTETVVFWRLKR